MGERLVLPVWTNILLAALTTSFGAWAGVVWQIGQDLSTRQTEILVELATVKSELTSINSSVSNHQAKPWHNQAGEALIRLQEQLTRERESR